jgi:hypothetical protein
MTKKKNVTASIDATPARHPTTQFFDIVGERCEEGKQNDNSSGHTAIEQGA